MGFRTRARRFRWKHRHPADRRAHRDDDAEEGWPRARRRAFRSRTISATGGVATRARSACSHSPAWRRILRDGAVTAFFESTFEAIGGRSDCRARILSHSVARRRSDGGILRERSASDVSRRVRFVAARPPECEAGLCDHEVGRLPRFHSVRRAPARRRAATNTATTCARRRIARSESGEARRRADAQAAFNCRAWWAKWSSMKVAMK